MRKLQGDGSSGPPCNIQASMFRGAAFGAIFFKVFSVRMRDCACACTYHLGDTMATFNCQMKRIQFLNPRLQLFHRDQELAIKPQPQRWIILTLEDTLTIPFCASHKLRITNRPFVVSTSKRVWSDLYSKVTWAVHEQAMPLYSWFRVFTQEVIL